MPKIRAMYTNICT